MRPPTAILVVFFGVCAIGSLGCANRGMKPPMDGGPGDGGADGTAGRGGTLGTGGRGGTGGAGGGPTGTAGAGSGGTGTCDLAPGAETPGNGCNAMFNFETDAEGAAIGAGSTAFTGVMKVGTSTYCGSGALAITALFSGTSGASTKGEVLIPLPGAPGVPVDLTGKTITIHVAADPGCSADLYMSLVVNTTAGAYYFSQPFQVRPITSSWKTASGTVTADAGTMSALALSLQAFSVTGYQGTIYVDEIDIR